MNYKQVIYFSGAPSTAADNFSVQSSTGSYNKYHFCLDLDSGDSVKFNLNLPQVQGVTFIFRLCNTTYSDSEGGGEVENCPVRLEINGYCLADGFDPHITHFYDVVWSVPPNILHSGNNEIILKAGGDSTVVFLRHAVVDLTPPPSSSKNWLSTIDGATRIGDINLLGTHDSAAIYSSIQEPYACQNFSITQQLEGGIRLLDIRLKVKQTQNHEYTFVTCHSKTGSRFNLNEYQPFSSVLDECKAFLLANNSEMIVMLLKVDDWNGFDDDGSNVLNALRELLLSYPITSYDITYPIMSSITMPTLRSVKGTIVLFNRIDFDPGLGIPIYWSHNTEGVFTTKYANRAFDVYVQDRCEGLPDEGWNSYKLNLVTSTFSQKRPGNVVINFASATRYLFFGVYIMSHLLNYFGANPSTARPTQLGWILFDFPFWSYPTDNYGHLNIVDLIIASNHNYAGYTGKFQVDAVLSSL